MAILRVTCLALLASGLLTSLAYAQDDARRLDQMLPPASASNGTGSTTAGSAMSTGTAPASTAPASASTRPGVYYGDTSGIAGAATDDGDSTTASCNDADYKKPQLHGSVGAGVVAGKHASGSYQTGTVNITKPLGDCEHPTGSLSITVRDTRSRFDFPRTNH